MFGDTFTNKGSILSERLKIFSYYTMPAQILTLAIQKFKKGSPEAATRGVL